MDQRESFASYRKQAGLSQVQLAKKINVTQQTISSWERGQTIPKPYQMQQLEEVLNVSKEDLFHDAFYKK